MEYKIGVWTLTTDHPASHYGIPVLVDESGKAYGPTDPVNTPETDAVFGNKIYTAGKMISQHANQKDDLPSDVREKLALYCNQWPNGPQVLPAAKKTEKLEIY